MLKRMLVTGLQFTVGLSLLTACGSQKLSRVEPDSTSELESAEEVSEAIPYAKWTKPVSAKSTGGSGGSSGSTGSGGSSGDTSGSSDSDSGSTTSTTTSDPTKGNSLVNIYSYSKSSWPYNILYGTNSAAPSGYSSATKAFQLFYKFSTAAAAACTPVPIYQCLQYPTKSAANISLPYNAGQTPSQTYLIAGTSCGAGADYPVPVAYYSGLPNGFLGYACEDKNIVQLGLLKVWGANLYFQPYPAAPASPIYFTVFNMYQVLWDGTSASGWTYQSNLAYVPNGWEGASN